MARTGLMLLTVLVAIMGLAAAVKPGGQCGGFYGDNCRCSVGKDQLDSARDCKDEKWPWVDCEDGSRCIRHSQDYWQCAPPSWGWNGNPKPDTNAPPPLATLSDGAQCGGITGPDCYESNGAKKLDCQDSQWSWVKCGDNVPCVRSSCSYWQCRPKSWDGN